ncbi:DUF1737 domain-containing protein [Erythrobacter alti]|uniref:DUF1737 domain-containing protein n=1 Tax=Erythrobacter alti TaxID=1896145 RepID=UPI0030F3E4BC
MTQNAKSGPPDGRLTYRLITGTEDREFCEKVSLALEEGWVLHGEPRTTYDFWRGQVKCAQAVV